MSEVDDLTTDAVPSPPRDEIRNENQEQKFEETDINEEPRVKTKAKMKKPKKTAPTAYASVINISNATGIHIGSNINMFYNSNKKETSTKAEKDYTITSSIKTLFKSTEIVERKHLIFLAPHLNEDWRNTARLLDYSDGQISQFYEDYIRIGIKEVIYQLLLDWIQNEADGATIGKLSKTLWDTNQQDAVIRWSENFKLSNGVL